MIGVVRSTCQKYTLLAPGDVVVVGVSGGADSCALLLALVQLKEEWDLRLHVAHLNHQLRGAEAEADTAFVRALAEQLALPCTVATVDVPALAKERGWSVEQAGRAARYEFFNALADSLSASKIAVGHTADDLLETMLLNWCRGAGAEGLAGMPPKVGRVIRPLFEISREQARAFCVENGVMPRHDASNEDVRYQRNRVRHELVPHFKKLCPHILRRAVRLAEALREENAYLDGLARETLSALQREAKNGIMVIDVEELARQPLALLRRVLREAVRRVKGDLENVGFEHIEPIAQAVRHGDQKGAPQRVWTLPNRISVKIHRGRLWLKPPLSVWRPALCEWTLAVPGRVDVPPLGVRLRADVVDGVPSLESDPQKAFLDAETLGRELTVRYPLTGERFRPLGMSGTKKVVRFLADLKVPPEERGRTLVVASEGVIVWVVGYRIDDRYKVTPHTRQTVILSVQRH
ncbi:MAG: tRNA lysidine(34) synthetase TilS [Abditibacteriales bacterium]|nr:tRNA lysidine(34) synthetase TilS [Abditibacteriales bacterium]MDW8368126.1 tRNA lysidine(34) synthetase TilS [Abditibacteriales bacterium]